MHLRDDGESLLETHSFRFSVAELLEHEQAHLMPMPAAFDGHVETLLTPGV